MQNRGGGGTLIFSSNKGYAYFIGFKISNFNNFFEGEGGRGGGGGSAKITIFVFLGDVEIFVDNCFRGHFQYQLFLGVGKILCRCLYKQDGNNKKCKLT